MQDIDPKHLTELTHLNVSAMHGRMLPLMPLWDGDTFVNWIPAADRLFKLSPNVLVEGEYWATAQADPLDLRFEFLELMWKRASWKNVATPLTAISADVNNLAALIAKLDYFWTARTEIGGSRVSRFVMNEIEHLLTVCRSLFDLLQELLVSLWGRVRMIREDGSQEKPKKPLPSSFREMIMKDNALLAAGEIATQRGIPQQLAEVYAEWGSFLEALRAARDGIVHRGKSAPFVFVDGKCFAIPKEDLLARAIPNRLASWDANEQLVSLRPVLAHWLFGTLTACERFAQVLGEHFMFPSDICPGHRLFMRTLFGREFRALQAVASGGASPFWTDGA